MTGCPKGLSFGWDRRLERERRTLEAMAAIYCRSLHKPRSSLCPDCRIFLDYASGRLDRCPLKNAKPTCAKCPVHCYKPDMRKQAGVIMRYSGPRMLMRHPVLALLHWLDGFRKTSRPR